MILEAFAAYLHQADQRTPATEVLANWLAEKLSAAPRTNVDRVLHCEVSMTAVPEQGLGKTQKSKPGSKMPKPDKSDFLFTGKSKSGRQLLRSLYEYCQSYEQQKWSRFVHRLKASDFNSEGKPH